MSTLSKKLIALRLEALTRRPGRQRPAREYRRRSRAEDHVDAP
jgi:hypothetical protein